MDVAIKSIFATRPRATAFSNSTLSQEIRCGRPISLLLQPFLNLTEVFALRYYLPSFATQPKSQVLASHSRLSPSTWWSSATASPNFQMPPAITPRDSTPFKILKYYRDTRISDRVSEVPWSTWFGNGINISWGHPSHPRLG